jgi:hypothetical protein
MVTERGGLGGGGVLLVGNDLVDAAGGKHRERQGLAILEGLKDLLLEVGGWKEVLLEGGGCWSVDDCVVDALILGASVHASMDV